MKKHLLIWAALLLLLPIHKSEAQSSVTEIHWSVANYTYHGLLVLYPNDRGDFIVKFPVGPYNWGWAWQDAVVSSTADMWGNRTIYINCYNPRSSIPNSTYFADNFIIYPNGNMFTQDAAGTWSTAVNANVVAPGYWPMKFREYNYRPR